MDPTTKETQTNQSVQSESLEEFSDSSQAADVQSAASIVPSASVDATAASATDPDRHKRFFRIFLIISLVGLFALAGGGVFWLTKIRRINQIVKNVNEKYEVTNLVSESLNSKGQILSPSGSPSEVAINGSIQIAGALRLVPTDRPTDPVSGQQYIDKNDNKLYVYNGTTWLAQLSVADLSTINTNITSLQVASASTQENATLQGNVFNGPNQLLQLGSSGKVADSLLSGNITLQGNTFNGASQLLQLDLLGKVDDNLLSSNVAFLGAPTQTFTGNNIFSGTVTANTIQPTSSMTVGLPTQQLTLQGNATSSFVVSGGGFNTTVNFANSPIGSVVYNFDRSAIAGTYTICTTAGNCLGGGGGGANTSLSNLTAVAINTSLLPGSAGAINLGSLALPFGQLYIAGTSASPATNKFLVTGVSTGGLRTITIPDNSGTICLLEAGNCLGGAGGGANTTLSNLSSPTAINQTLQPGSAGAIDLGASGLPFGQLYMSGTSATPATNNFLITGASTSGTRTLTLPDSGGTIAAGALTQYGVLYGNGGSAAVSSLVAGSAGQCLVSTVSAPSWGSCAGSGSGAVTLQNAYDGGATATVNTTNARDLKVTLANTSTDSNFLVDIATGSSSKFAVQNNGTDTLRVDTSGGVFANSDITINKRADATSNTYTQYNPPPSLGYPSIYTGTYTGNGGASQTINLPSGWGTPQVAIVMETSSSIDEQPRIKTTTMSGTQTKPLGGAGNLDASGYIDSLGSDQIVVATSFNKTSRAYAYLVIRADTGSYDNYFTYGSYSGNGSDNRTISLGGPSWTPDYVMVIKANGNPGTVPWFRTSDMSGDNAIPTANGTLATNRIQGFSSGGFEIGNDTDVNHNTYDFHWFALKKLSGFIDTVSYTGTGSSQNVNTSSNFRPDLVFTKINKCTPAFGGCSDVNPDYLRHMSMWTAGFASPESIKLPTVHLATTGITGTHSTGYTVLSDYSTNETGGSTYYSMSLKNQTTTATNNGYSSGVVYNGKFYTATKRIDSSEIYRWDSGSTWTKVSSNSAGKISGTEATANIDSVPVMKVYDGKLFAGSETGSGTGKATVYYCSNGSGNCAQESDWTQVNTTQGTLDGGTTAIDSITSMAVVNGVLYVGTGKASSAEIYRYNGGSGAAVFTKISDSTAGKVISGDTANIDGVKLINYQGMLYAGTLTGSDQTAALYAYAGDSSWSLVNPTRGTFASTANIDDITVMAVYNGSLVLGTGDSTANLAEIYRYNAPQGGATSGAGLFSKISDSTAGRIDSTGSARVDRVGAMTVYNGYLLASSDNNTSDASGTIYEFNGVNSWSKLGTESEGTLGGIASNDGVLSLTQYNDLLWAGGGKSSAGYVYTFQKNSSISYALKFAGTADGTFDNIGTFSFMSADQADGNFSNHGQFLLSHTLTTSAGAYDIAEDYQTSDDELSAGDVAAIDPTRPYGFVRRADLTKSDGLRLLGIVSTKPAFRLSQKENHNAEVGSRTIPIALAGRVPVKIDPDSEAITPGDYLAASSKVGLAVKTNQSGAVIAKALEAWNKDSGKDRIEVFVTNTFLLPNAAPIDSSLRDQIEHGLKKVSLLDAFLTTTQDGWQFLKDSTFIGKVFFAQDVIFGGRLAFTDTDMAGRAKIKQGQKEVKIKFEKPYEDTPIVSVSPQTFVVYKIKDKDKTGFTIELEETVAKDIDFDWLAINMQNPKTTESDPL